VVIIDFFVVKNKTLCHNTCCKIPVFDRNLVFRVYQRAKQPVAGIDVREHFEVNLGGLTFTAAFYLTNDADYG
jgi:hypothetical protein